MKLHFNLKNEELVDYLLLSADGQEFRLSAEAREAQTEVLKEQEFLLTAIYQRDTSDKSSKNPISRVLLAILGVVIYVIVGLIMLFDGEKFQVKGFFKGTNPFIIKKTVRIKPTKSTVGIIVKDAEFDVQDKIINEPEIILDGAEILEENTEIYFRKEYAEKQFKKDLFLTYAILYALVIALNILGIMMLVNIMLSPNDIYAKIGAVLMEIFFASLVAVPIYLTVKVYKVYKQIYNKLSNSYPLV